MYVPIKVILIILASLVAYTIQVYVVRPRFLEPACLIHSDKCVQLEYYRKDNSVFVTVRPSLYRLWFNGTTFYVYDLVNTGRTCADPAYQPAYEVNPVRNYVQNYHCIRNLKEVLKYYEGTPKEIVSVPVKDVVDFSAYDVIEYLVKQQIIALPEKTK